MGIRLARDGSVTGKALLMGAIVLLLLIPLALLRGLVSERASLREQAYARVAEGWGGSLVTSGPMLVIPTERTVTERSTNDTSRRAWSAATSTCCRPTLDADVELKLEHEPRYVGIYGVPVYLGDVAEAKARSISPPCSALSPDVTLPVERGALRLPLSQVRSLREVTARGLRGRKHWNWGPPDPACCAASKRRSIWRARSTVRRCRSSSDRRRRQPRPLGPAARQHDDGGACSSNWPHPSFQGAFLPVERQIGRAGLRRRAGRCWS